MDPLTHQGSFLSRDGSMKREGSFRSLVVVTPDVPNQELKLPPNGRRMSQLEAEPVVLDLQNYIDHQAVRPSSDGEEEDVPSMLARHSLGAEFTRPLPRPTKLKRHTMDNSALSALMADGDFSRFALRSLDSEEDDLVTEAHNSDDQAPPPPPPIGEGEAEQEEVEEYTPEELAAMEEEAQDTYNLNTNFLAITTDENETTMVASARDLPSNDESNQIAFFGDLKAFRGYKFGAHDSVRDIFRKADLIVGNFETIVTLVPTDPAEIARSHPKLKGRDVRRVVDRGVIDSMLREMGASPERCVLSVANNHAANMNLDMTVECLESLGAVVIGHTAGGILTKVLVGAQYVGFVAWTKDVGKNKHAAIWTQKDVDAVNWKQVKQDMGLATLIAFPHWDSRRKTKVSSARQREARKLQALGFDIIVGHGSHTLKSCEHQSDGNIQVGSLDENIQGVDTAMEPNADDWKTTSTPSFGSLNDSLCVYSLGHINNKAPSRKLHRRLSAIFSVVLQDGRLMKYAIDPIVHTLMEDSRGGAGVAPNRMAKKKISLATLRRVSTKALVAQQKVNVKRLTMLHTLESAPPMNNEMRNLDKRLQNLFPSYDVALTGYQRGLQDLVRRRHRYSIKLFSPDEGHAALSIRLIGDRAQGVWHDLKMGSGRKLFRSGHPPRFFFTERRHLGRLTHIKLLIKRRGGKDEPEVTDCSLTRVHVTYIGSTAQGAEYPAQQFDFPVIETALPTKGGRRISLFSSTHKVGMALKRTAEQGDVKVLLRVDPEHKNRPEKEDDVALLRTIDEQILSNVQTGDIIAFASRSRLAPYTRRMTGSPITHVGSVVVNDGQTDAHWRPVALLYEATLNGDGSQDFAMQRSHGKRKHLGVWGFSLVERIMAYSGDVWYVPLRQEFRLNTEQKQHMASFLKRVHMDLVPYDKTQLVTQALERLTGIDIDWRQNDIRKLFCSEMVAEAIRRAGMKAVEQKEAGEVVDPIWEVIADVHSSETSPVECCRLPVFVPEPFLKVKNFLE